MKGMRRPKTTVLSDDALVPDQNLIRPAPNQFTHEIMGATQYYYGQARPGDPPDGELAAGTRVVLLRHEGGDVCRVADGRGLYVEVPFAALRKL